MNDENRLMKIVCGLLGIAAGVLVSSALWQPVSSQAFQVCLSFGVVCLVALLFSTHWDWF